MTWAAVAVLVAAMAGQSFWIARSLDALRAEIRAEFDAIKADLRELRADVQSLRDVVVRDHGERIARLEERMRA